MRVTCFFVSVAIILAQQANAAPIVGLSALGNEEPLVHSLSNTVAPVPLIGGLLESEDDNELLSTTELVGNDGLINDHSRLGQITHSLQRPEGMSLVHDGLGSMTNDLRDFPLVGSIQSILPVTQGLNGLQGAAGSMPLASSLLKRNDISPLSTIYHALPGASEISSALPLGSMPGIDAIDSLPGLSNVGDLASTLPIPALSKRTSVLASLPVLSSIGNIASHPVVSSVPLIGHLPSVDSLLARGYPGVGQISSLASNPIKRDMSLATIPVIGSIPGIDSLPAMPSIMSSLPSISSVPFMHSPLKRNDGLASILGLSTLESVSPISNIPSVSVSPLTSPITNLLKQDSALGPLPLVGTIPGISSLSSTPGISSLPSALGTPALPLIPESSSPLHLPLTSSLPTLPTLPGVGGLTPTLPALGSITSIL